MVSPFGSGTLPSGGADPQDFYYLNYVMPGSYSRQMYETRVCNPLWGSVFGCKTNPQVVGQTTMTEEQADAQATADVASTGDATIQSMIDSPARQQMSPIVSIVGGLAVGVSVIYLFMRG
tara:strand:+ start:1146 stop:1505 length:360 start_codon:yes stop_codon:yes gene_type:complete